LGSATARAFGASSAKVGVNYVSRPDDAGAFFVDIKNAETEAITVLADISALASVARHVPIP